jgi:SulP family sulfate permease
MGGLGLFRSLASFISEPVLKGFIVGLALTIIVGQLPKLFGVPGGEGELFAKTWDLIRSLPETQGWTLAVGVASLAVALGLRRFAPLVPGSLVAVGLGIAAVPVLGLAGARRPDPAGTAPCRPAGRGADRLPQPDGCRRRDPPGRLRRRARRGQDLRGAQPRPHRRRPRAARPWPGQPRGRPHRGDGGQRLAVEDGVNGNAGARSQLSGLVVAALTVLTLLFLTGLFQNLPEATLAAVVVTAVIELVDVASLRRL